MISFLHAASWWVSKVPYHVACAALFIQPNQHDLPLPYALSFSPMQCSQEAVCLPGLLVYLISVSYLPVPQLISQS